MNHRLFLVGLLVLVCLSFYSCGDDDDDNNDSIDDDTDDDAADDDLDDDTSDDDLDDDTLDDDTDDDTVDDDTLDDDTGDDDTIEPTPAPNPSAKADAFQLFYKERSARAITSLNRFSFSGDTVAANAFCKMAIAKDGDEYEVVPGPEGNNPFGKSAFSTWMLYQAIGGRNLELSMIRMFEGMVFNEAISGHPGLTTREALPGWTRTIDGDALTTTRTKWGVPVAPPVAYSSALETEIIETFFDGLTFRYRENPEEYLFNFKAINELTTFAIVYVFEQLDHDPPFLRVSDCCSSFMIAQQGTWTGAYWGNHNSRDNFTDIAMGFLAAMEVASTKDLPADLVSAAEHAVEAAQRTGDNIIEHDSILMTVDEFHDYQTLPRAGDRRPDGETEWQDLGSLSSCQMAYVAQAISSDGLDTPVPVLPLPGAVETTYLHYFFEEVIGITIPLPTLKCRTLDDAFIGMGWGDILNMEIFGIPWYEIAEAVAVIWPELFPDLLGSMMDDFQEMELGAVALCYYAQLSAKPELFAEARQTLSNLIELQKILAKLVYGLTDNPDTRTRLIDAFGEEAVARQRKSAAEMLYKAATYARMFDIDWPLEDFGDFTLGDERTGYIESFLQLEDTQPWALLSDDEIKTQIETRLAQRESWTQTRYWTRFPEDPPVRRAGDGYECLGPDDEWMATENPRHVWMQDFELWFEAPLCVFAPTTLDCSWAQLGCAHVDFDGSGLVDDADEALFTAAYNEYGTGATCSAGNDWCDGADLDLSGVLDDEDTAFMTAALGCWYDL